MWILLALSASVLWGVSYAASGRILSRGLDPVAFFFCYAIFTTLFTGAILLANGELFSVPREVRGLGKDWIWLLVALGASSVGGLLIYEAIGEKNATLASLIEISYPFFVALFAWVFFRETQFNLATVLGGLLILGGVFTVFVGNRN
jgi:drug/metabolite transporter (DMT)-like permease